MRANAEEDDGLLKKEDVAPSTELRQQWRVVSSTVPGRPLCRRYAWIAFMIGLILLLVQITKGPVTKEQGDRATTNADDDLDGSIEWQEEVEGTVQEDDDYQDDEMKMKAEMSGDGSPNDEYDEPLTSPGTADSSTELPSKAKQSDGNNEDQENSYPLVEAWPEPIWPKNAPILTAVMDMLTGKTEPGPLECSDQTASSQIRMAIYGSGFGASIMNIVGNTIFAHYTQKRFVLVSRRNRPYDPDRAGEKINEPNVISEIYEREFSFPRKETLCTNWTAACPAKGDRDCRGASTSPVVGVMKSYERMTKKLMRTSFETFMSLRVELVRFLTQMKRSMRQSVDERLGEFLPQTVFSKVKKGLVIGIHLRRSDKIIREATLTPASDYIRAAAAAWRSIKPAADVRKVIIVTDDANAAKRVEEAWSTTPIRRLPGLEFSKPSEGFAIRAVAAQESGRPDFLVALDDKTLRVGRQGVVDLLVDLKLLVLADVFVGTQSSNFGLLACYMRGGRACYNAENSENSDYPYAWDHKEDKLS